MFKQKARNSRPQHSQRDEHRNAIYLQAKLQQPKKGTKDLKLNRLYVFNGKHRGKQTSRERTKIDKSVERESATILLQV